MYNILFFGGFMNTILYTLGLDDLFLQKKDLTNYKINYSNPIGKGCFGSV